MIGAGCAVVAWIPFLHPLELPAGARLWMLLPLLICVALVYRATRAHVVADMPKATAATFLNILLSMVGIALAFYVVHRAVLWLAW